MSRPKKVWIAVKRAELLPDGQTYLDVAVLPWTPGTPIPFRIFPQSDLSFGSMPFRIERLDHLPQPTNEDQHERLTLFVLGEWMAEVGNA